MDWDKFLNLCNSIGKSPSAVAVDIGLSDAAPTGWKKGSKPRPAILSRLASYFGVPVEYLLPDNEKTATNDGDGLSAKDARLLAWFRSLPQEKQKEILYDADAPSGLV